MMMPEVSYGVEFTQVAFEGHLVCDSCILVAWRQVPTAYGAVAFVTV